MPTNLEIEKGGQLKLSWFENELCNKCNFVADLSNIICHYIPSIDKIEYEVWTKPVPLEALNNILDTEVKIDYREYIVVHYNGGAIAPRNVNINSLQANFREIGLLLDGGYYTEVDAYKALPENGYVKSIYQSYKNDIV